MKVSRLILPSCLLLLVLSACASHKYTVVEPTTKNLADYETLEIADFKCNLSDHDSKKLANSFADRLYTNVLTKRQKDPDEIIFDEVVRKTDKTEGVLLMEGTVTSYEKGSRVKRYFVGFGAGKSYCTIHTVFTDKATGEQVQKVNFDGELSMGVFGGSEEQAVQGVVDAYIDFFHDYFVSNKPK